MTSNRNKTYAVKQKNHPQVGMVSLYKLLSTIVFPHELYKFPFERNQYYQYQNANDR